MTTLSRVGRVGLAVLVLLASATAPLAAPSLTPIASIQHYVQVGQGPDDRDWRTVCTAFSIDEKRGLFMTAAHCLPDAGGGMTLDGHIAWVVYRNEPLDIAVLESRGAYRPQLPPCRRNATLGEEVMSVGHAYGLPEPWARFGRVARAYAYIPFGAGGPVHMMVLDTPLIGGMSGGPMLMEQEGIICVVGLNQQSSMVAGMGQPIEVLTANTAQFWGRT